MGESIITSRICFFVADAGRARLLACSRTPQGRIHVEERASLDNHKEEHEHNRPSPRAGKNGHSYASEGHEDEAQRHRFAKSVVDWMEQQSEALPNEEIFIFSAPRFLGEIRKLYPPGLAGRLRERPGDLTQLNPANLARHPAVEALVEELL